MISGPWSKHKTLVNHFPKMVGSPATTLESCTQVFSMMSNVLAMDTYGTADPVYPYKLQDMESQEAIKTHQQAVVNHTS